MGKTAKNSQKPADSSQNSPEKPASEPLGTDERSPVAEAATDLEETNGASFAGDFESETAENEQKEAATSQPEKSAAGAPVKRTAEVRKELASQLAGDAPAAPIVTEDADTTIAGNEMSGLVAPIRVVSYITVRIPVLEPSAAETGYRARGRRHIDLQLDRAQAEAMRHIACALDLDDSHRLNNGQRIARHADVARYVVDQIVSQVPAARALVDRSRAKTLAG